ncbi:MAG: hypothetical protein PHE32_04165 [Candidatus Shapirobacteria bacterium]|nr:hypothetical protein [Candidatus Shapirobacteria bacterium]
MKGWIKIHKRISKWEWYDDANTFRVFFHLLISVNHKDKQWHEILIKRGQVLVGIEKLGKKLKLTRQQVRTSLDKLILTNEITKSTTSLYTIITVNNFNKYQLNNQVDNKPVTNEEPSRNQVVTTTKDNISLSSNNNKDSKKRNNNKTKKSIRGKITQEIIEPEIEKVLSDEKWVMELCQEFGVPRAFILSKADDMVNYCVQKQISYENYKLAIRNWVKKDSIEIRRKQNEQRTTRSTISTARL